MSSTGVREENNNQKRVIKGLIKNEEQFIQSLRVFANTSTLSGLGATESEASNSPVDASGNFLTKAGDTMLGPIAFFPVDVTIDTGIINISDVTDDHSSRVIISTEGAAPTDDLDRINGARFAGQFLSLQGIIGQTITINNDPSGTGTGQFNIRTPDGNPFILSGNQNIILFFDSIANQWVIVTGGGSGGGGISYPVRPPVENLGNLGTDYEFILSNPTGHVLKFVATADLEITFNNYPIIDEQQTWEVEVKQDVTGGHVVTFPQVLNPPVLDTTPDSTTIVVFRTNDGGATIRVGNTVTTSAGTLSGLLIDANKDWLGFDITNLGFLSMTGDINVNTHDVFNIDRAIFALSEGFVSSPADTAILLNANNQFQFNTDENNLINFSFDNISAFVMETEVSVNDTRLFSLLGDETNANSVPHLRFIKPQLVGVDDSLIGALDFLAGDDIGSALSNYFSIDVFLEDNTNTSKDGTVIFNCMIDNILTDILQLNRGSDGGVSIFGTGLNMQARKIQSLADPTLAQDAATKAYVDANIGVQNEISQGDSNVTVTDAGTGLIAFTVDNVLIAQMQNNRMDFQQTDLFGIEKITFNDGTATSVFTQTNTNLTLNFPNSVTVFDVDFNSVVGFSIDELKTQIHSTNPNTTPPELSLFRNDTSPVNDEVVGFIDFTGRNSAAENVSYAEIQTEIGNVTDGAEEGILRFITEVAGVSVNTLTLVDGRMTLNKFSSVDTDAAELRLVKEDATPNTNDRISEMNFQVLDAGVLTTYAEIRSEIKDAPDAGRLHLSVRADNSDLSDGLIMEGDDNVNDRSYLAVNSYINSDLGFGFDGVGSLQAKIRPKSASTQLGIVVQDNVDFTVGVDGTLAMPVFDDITPTKSELDTSLGTHQGSMGLNESTVPANRIYVRLPNGDYAFFNADGVITT